ncbi:MAG: flagellar filament capping protein FliD [Planctomycetota bacterium]|jgi:flagellar hook-associated protein 2
MGTITTGVGLISGIDTASLVESLLAIEGQGKARLEDRIASLQAQQTALLDINARLLNLKGSAGALSLTDNVFRSVLATSSDEEVLTATATSRALPGTFQFTVRQLAAASQQMTRGFADLDTTPVGLDSLSFEFGRGRLRTDADLADLNGGAGVARGTIRITDRTGAVATVDLTDVTTLDETLDRINGVAGASVTASVDGDRLVVTDTSGGGGSLTIEDLDGRTTALDLGVAGSDPGGVITGTTINTLGGATALETLRDDNGVLVRNGVPDLRITARDGTQFDVDLGRVNAPIDDDTLLSDLNNGLGVTLSDDSENPDIRFTARDGTAFDVDLTGVSTVGGLRSRVAAETGGQITLTVTDGERLTVTDTVGGGGTLSVAGAGDNGTDTAEDLGILNGGVAADSFDGTPVPNTLTSAPVVTLQEVIDRINDAVDTTGGDNAGRITASIAADGVSLQVDDATGGGGNLVIVGAPGTSDEVNAAAHLGIFTGAGGVGASSVDGERLIAALGSVLVANLNGGQGLFDGPSGALSGSTLLSDLFQGAGLTTNGSGSSPDITVSDRENNSYDVEVDGLTTVSDLIAAFDTATGGNVTLSIDSQSLRVTDTTGGNRKLRIADIGGASVASELGITVNANVDTVLGVDTDPAASAPGIIDIVNRAGGGATIDVSGAESVREIIDAINASGADVVAGFNRAGNGLAITDTSGGTGNLQVTGTGAAALRIEADVAAGEVQGKNVQLRYVSDSSRLDALNYGRGVGTGTFRITDGLGATAEVSVGSDAVTLDDVIAEINSRGLAVRVRVNDQGDGLVIEEDLGAGQTAFVPIKVETVSGSAAADLNLIGESDLVEGGFIDGSYERVVDFSPTDDLNEVVGKINDAGLPVSASILNTGSGATPYRINFTSDISGRDGEIIIDSGDVDLGLSVLQTGQDAKVFFGGADPADALLVTSSTNTVEDAINGVTIDLHRTTTDPVTLTLERDAEGIVGAVRDLVTTINDVIGRVNDYDFYDVETEQRGVLLGSPVTARLRDSLYRTVTGRAEGVETQFQTLTQVGIRVGAEGQLTFDEDVFREAYERDRVAVENLFIAFEATTATSEEIAPGVTVTRDAQAETARGFGELLEDLADQFTNSVDGVLTRADDNFEDLIELTNDRIDRIDERLDARRLQLETEFAAMEAALADLQSQNNALLSLASSISQSAAALRAG